MKQKRITLEQARKRLLEEIEIAKFPVLMAPLCGRMVPIIVRELNAVQIRACGNISLIESFNDKLKREGGHFKRREIVAFAERHREILKAALVAPTYDELFETLTKYRFEYFESKLKEIDATIAELKASGFKGPKLNTLEEERDSLRIWIDLFLPDDFVGCVVSYALGIGKSDIKKVTEDMLFEAAYLADRGKDNPSDHLPGEFTQFMIDDINLRAWSVFDQRREEARENAG
jgi:hypothetical protein